MIKQSKKIQVEDLLNTDEDFDGMTGDQMMGLIDNYQEKYDDVFFRYENNWETSELQLIGSREETNAEFKVRTDKEGKAREKARIALEKKKAKVEKEARKLGLIP